MEELLKELGFKETNQSDNTGYYKYYKGFTLFVAKKIVNEEYLTCITVGKNIEISIPFYVDILWVRKFDSENT